jgi:Tfp pilus assembly protein PilE
MKYQSGTTLISLLIGLLIAMLCILALLSSYRTIVKTGVESRIAATHDTQLQAALTTAQMMLQNAGFGLQGSNNLLTTTIQVGSKTISAVLWRYNNGTNIVCQGLADVESSDNKKRRFILLEGFENDSSAPCNGTLNLASFKWKVQSTLANLEDYSSDKSNPKQITFSQTTSACTPFGAGTVEESYQYPLITISAKTSTQKIAGLGTVQVPICLLNIAS